MVSMALRKFPPENTVVGDLGADNAADDSPAVHSHSQLQSGTGLMLRKIIHQMFSCTLQSGPPVSQR